MVEVVAGVAGADPERDLRELVLEYIQTWGDPETQLTDAELAWIAALPEPAVPPAGGAWLAYVDKVPAGCVLLLPPGPLTGGLPELAKLYVKPSYRRHGLARALTRAAITAAGAAGASGVYLIVQDWREPAIELYLSLGFRALPKQTVAGYLELRWDAPQSQ